ncbi:winged helix-turn-helix transcriptional regulator [Spiroplasma cantharicola]|uniref:MarR family transcriptional regulator n=1 Tax=Spiroplasma cantharicola TaxID=362837 RepID=A0A0M4JJZ8_9MOLU|nr:helix-turn-helix domain-containing protein [Spiroplasma cantharicola]ALD66611.1 MarR family transcriptional regulator [Spiroplasma cantharicola]
MQTCPVEFSLSILKNKWTIFIIRELLTTEKRFNELKRNIPGVTTKVLTETLKHLEKMQIIDREVEETIPLKVTYSLTNLGISLKPVLDSLSDWGVKNLNNAN